MAVLENLGTRRSVHPSQCPRSSPSEAVRAGGASSSAAAERNLPRERRNRRPYTSNETVMRSSFILKRTRSRAPSSCPGQTPQPGLRQPTEIGLRPGRFPVQLNPSRGTGRPPPAPRHPPSFSAPSQLAEPSQTSPPGNSFPRRAQPEPRSFVPALLSPRTETTGLAAQVFFGQHRSGALGQETSCGDAPARLPQPRRSTSASGSLFLQWTERKHDWP